MTAACGFGHQGMCCCECALRLVAKPRCHHLGGKGVCGPYAPFDANVLDRIVADVERARLEEEQGTSYVCLAFADEGIAQTDWLEHGCCEMWTPKTSKTKAMCVADGCDKEADLKEPANWCQDHWQAWWDCEDCTDVEDCKSHARETGYTGVRTGEASTPAGNRLEP